MITNVKPGFYKMYTTMSCPFPRLLIIIMYFIFSNTRGVDACTHGTHVRT